MSKPWVLVSPSSRGIGHALTRHLLRTTTLPILATARSDPAKVKDSLLEGLGAHQQDATTGDLASRLTLLQLDVTDEASIQAAAGRAAELFPPRTHHLHLGFALPGVLHVEKKPRQVGYESALEMLKINLLGPLMLIKWFGDFLPRKLTDLSLSPTLAAPSPSRGIGTEATTATTTTGGGMLPLPRHAVWLSAAARVGSTSDNRLGGWYSYRASKAGVISVMRGFDLHLRLASADKAIGIAYHPGTVRTGLSAAFWDQAEREGTLLSPEFAAERMMHVVARTQTGDRGRCLDWKGEIVLP
ncbi:short-chain dehydrogenase/reductase-like protein [Biscogniauxia mediterranea]|nr:short-chain dehydrogenase/reductase-like protein [Biscogniauxia mediterranea]